MIWKNQRLLFRAYPIYFLYLLAHLSFYFQKIHFQTFFHLPSLLLSCCFFCTQAGNLFWKRCFNISSSQQSFYLLAHLYLSMLVHHRVQLKNTWWDSFPQKIPKAKCSLAHAICITLWNPPARSQYRCTEEEGREENSMGRMWKYEISNTSSMTNSATKSENSKSLTVFQLRLTRPENWLFFDNRKEVFFHSHWWDPRWKN